MGKNDFRTCRPAARLRSRLSTRTIVTEMGWLPVLQILAVTGMHLKFGVCTGFFQDRFDNPKQIKMMSTGSHPLSNKFLQNVTRAGEAAEQCPACTEALNNFEDFHVESLKKIGVEPSNEIRLAEMESKFKKEMELRLTKMTAETKLREAKITAELTTLRTDIAPLLFRRALNVAVQAALVIAGVQPKDPIPPSNRFRYLLSSNQDFSIHFTQPPLARRPSRYSPHHKCAGPPLSP
jgi:hypothetical protein